MPIIIDAVQVLIEKNVTYKVDGDIYYRVNSDPEFLSRSHLSDSEKVYFFSQRGGDPERAGKEDPLDALIWRSAREGEPSWPSPMGAGRPGWHIECSAIALEFLRPAKNSTYSIDIQGGGSDLIFPHHEMSAAQCFSMTGRPFAQMYIHAGMIGLTGEKMSKSLGNLIFVSDLLSRGVPAMAIRWALMNRSYGEDTMWNEVRLSQAISETTALQLALAREEVAPTDLVIESIIESLANNLDTPAALAALNQWSSQTIAGSTGGSAGELSRAIDTLLGIAL
jgi:L-cysteine:1D-myo-inositol 2-amino-2-deoxy-alpha-D-glucopyranoside ligase